MKTYVLMFFATIFLIVAAPRSLAQSDQPTGKTVIMQPVVVPLGGINLKVIWNPEKKIHDIEITSVRPGSNAEKAGVVAGMKIRAIQGKSTVGLTAEQFQEVLQQDVTDFHRLAIAPKGSRVTKMIIQIPIPAVIGKAPEPSATNTVVVK